ncbi:MAG: hypothetical protein V4635_17775 [Bacteroidota bacterium]
MNELAKKYFNACYITVCLLVFVVICLRAFFIPFSHDEASTFFFYIQSDNYLPYRAHVYTNNHVLNSALANICYHIAGSHRFVLRIPNILSFIVLCLGVFNFFKYLNRFSSKIILTCFFILTFNLLDFFELCRGYGLSLAFMICGLSYLQDYFTTKRFKALLMFSVLWQLALAANLTLVVLSTILILFIFVFQLRQKLLFSKPNLLLQGVNLAILAFWVKFSFFYKSKGVLDSGVGNDYWVVSFKSLMLFIFGTDALWMQGLVLVLFFAALIFVLVQFSKTTGGVLRFFRPLYFYLTVLIVLLVTYYLMKKLLNINYPEDRTGLFFYVFFALALTFFFDNIGFVISSVVSAAVLTVSCVYFCLSFNLQSFTHYFYHVIPREFYSYLESEQLKHQQLFTIGGHPNREMNYAFLNYRAGGHLNAMDEPREMHMNCDYYFALMCEKPFYRYFYDEVAYDNRWHRVLLKRKQPIKRSEVVDMTRGVQDYSGKGEYIEFLRYYDSTGLTRNCVEADLEIIFKKVPKPFKAFLVLQVNDENNNSICYKRALLNWMGNDLSGKTKRFKLTSGPMPGKYKNIIVYLWNIDKKQCAVQLKQLKMLNLDAPGINVVIPKNYYPYVKKIIKEELL